MESLHKGEPQDVHIDSSDPNLRRVSRAFNEMCRRLEDESKTYSAKLLSSIEEERRRIGRELHDDTSQTLAAVMINLDLVDKALARRVAELSASASRTRRSFCATRSVRSSCSSTTCVPSMLDDFGLVPTLRWYIQSYSEGSGPSIELDVEAATVRLPGDVETALFRITQEAIANAVKHSGATKVVVRLETAPGFVSLAVIDNGEGFDPREAIRHSQPGLGLLSIKERVELLDGTLSIESHKGRGTRVYVVIPLPAGATRPTPSLDNEPKVRVP